MHVGSGQPATLAIEDQASGSRQELGADDIAFRLLVVHLALGELHA